MNLSSTDSSYSELTSSALKLIMEVSINKLRNFQNTLQSSVGPSMRTTENKNSTLLTDSSVRTTPLESIQQSPSRRTSSTFSPTRSILLSQQALNSTQTDSEPISLQNTSTSEKLVNSHSDNGQQCNLSNISCPTTLTSHSTNTCSDVSTMCSIRHDEQKCKRIYDCVSDDSSVSSSKRVFDTKLSAWTCENQVSSNFQHESSTTDERHLHYNEPINMMYHSSTENSIQAEMRNSDSNPISSTETLRSNTSLKQITHKMDYDEMNDDCGRDICICLPNSSNSRPLITGII
ncbi:unnamed protein product [Heterobilharzia americana]|nr:unnamed protein product [Heterobilharzia americana]